MVIIVDILFKYNSLDVNYDYFIRDIKCDVIECIYNYIDMDSKIFRKGVIFVNKDEIVIILVNMRDGIILGKGKGNFEWNYLVLYGVGRILLRGKVKEKIFLDEFEEFMKEIFIICVG